MACKLTMPHTDSSLQHIGGAEYDKYQKLSPREHVLKRPDTYIGSVSSIEEEHNILIDSKICPKIITYTPGLAKIFDEVLVNALDHVVRLEETKGQEKVTHIYILIDPNTGELGVCNDGDGIDAIMHPKYNMYVPQLIFGELLTSTNYDDGNQEKLWGGRNGYGAKLANIWSVWFEVETYDKVHGILYKQRFEKNMGVIGKPKISKRKTGRAYTRITFLPDYHRMGLTGLTEDMTAALSRRAYDSAALTPQTVSIFLNGEKLPVRKFIEYVALYPESAGAAVFSSKSGRWDVALTPSQSTTFENVSFVNGVSTRKGGTHVTYIANLIAKTAADALSKKSASLKPAYIKENMRLFLRCTIPNPTFSSQTKEELTSPPSSFSKTIDLQKADILKLVKNSGVMERAEALMAFHENRKVKAAAGKKTSRLFIPKLDDANNAGTSKSTQCTLILTEGDSAKTMAISGLAVVGRDNYGVFPLRGKLLNITDKSIASALKNEEVANIVKILGLKPGQVNSVGDLRYGRVMIMADSDDDGTHIRGLVMNLFHVFFPNLFQSSGFIVSMLTPVVKVKLSKDLKSFYSVDEYRAWQAKNTKPSAVKYYKGLGSSTASEAKEYFKDMQIVQYTYSAKSDERMSLAFSKHRADDRKQWLMKYSESSPRPDYTVKSVDYAQFVDTELIQFSVRDVARSIPHIMDGLKESIRKILYGCFKRSSKDADIKVAQLAGHVSEVSLYHHGEESLNKAITAMAQSFPGSNNIPLLEANGQFGTRIQGGEDRASPRYIHTKLASVTAKIFRPEDDVILNYKVDEGVQVEPDTYYPIIPMILVNGAVGIGTGFSTNVPMYNPLDLVEAVLNFISGKKVPLMKPWFRNWTGLVGEDGKGSFLSKGRVKKVKAGSFVIEELPVYRWTEEYKIFLESLVSDGVLKSMKSQYTDTDVRFEITLSPTTDVDESTLERILQLTSNRNLSTSNIHLFSTDGRITKFGSVNDVLDVWLTERLQKYGERKQRVMQSMNERLITLSAKARFIREVVDGQIEVMGVKAAVLEQKLKQKKFPQVDKSYKYLLKLPIQQLTLEKMEKLLEEEENLRSQLAELSTTPSADIWKREIQDLHSALKAL